MSRKKHCLLLLIGLLSAYFFICISPHTNENLTYIADENVVYPRSSASLEGAENILVTKLDRQLNISGYGLINLEDILTFKNLNANPITGVFIGIENPNELVFFEALGEDRNTLFAEKTYMKMNNYYMIAIYFDSAMLPQQSKTIRFVQSYSYQLNYGLYLDSSNNIKQQIALNELIYPVLPYRVEGEFSTTCRLPSSATNVNPGNWGSIQPDNTILYDGSTLDDPFLTPFLENLISAGKARPALSFDDNSITRIEIIDLSREIFISPWGVVL